ncbi:GNAT family N-acetyltransferase [Candidatus Merdisoma sp. JLR.KK006]|uniref:GNAT family N-acetyltransferase n=1 Tax=Candidatus Merdisoma sp. JLR.KK006 TaxID=3112626 RepID=UPI002FF05E12
MRLRELEMRDAPRILEWMHDKSVTEDLKTNFSVFTLEDAQRFILQSRDTHINMHKAIVSDTDEYMGTVSLKEIDYDKGNAEFAIVVHKDAMTRGYSWYGMTEILDIAFSKLKLTSVYWCVSRKNKRAVHFYDKHHFHESLDIPKDILRRYKSVDNLKWYSVLAGDDYHNEIYRRKKIAGCKIISIKTIPTVGAGELSFFEVGDEINFDIKRIYYISKVPEGVRRGFHAHKELKQILFCPYGKIHLILDEGNGREEITLSDPSIGVVIEHPVWREMLWMEKDSVLCVAASEHYRAEDYIRNRAEFDRYIKEAQNDRGA